MVLMMIYEGVDFVTAGRANGIQPDHARRWMHRPELTAFLRRERAVFRQAVCAQNEAVLASIRDERDGNQMARVAAVKCLEGLDAEAAARQPGSPSPGVTIRILNQVAVAPPLVDGGFRPAPAPAPEPADPTIFKPPRSW
jgi:hypothetical protein